jgi:hypothetical protein
MELTLALRPLTTWMSGSCKLVDLTQLTLTPTQRAHEPLTTRTSELADGSSLSSLQLTELTLALAARTPQRRRAGPHNRASLGVMRMRKNVLSMH